MTQKFGHHIGGKEVSASADAEFVTHNPVNGRAWGRFAAGTTADVDLAVNAAARAFSSWSRLSPTARGRLLTRWADALRVNAERIGKIESTQNGKLLRESVGQAGALPDWLYYYAGLADKIEGAVIPLERPEVVNYTTHEPLGRGRDHHAVELTVDAYNVCGRTSARRWQHDRDQALGDHLRIGDRAGTDRRVSWNSTGCHQRGDRPARDG